MEQLNPRHSPLSATTSASKPLYSRSAIRGGKNAPSYRAAELFTPNKPASVWGVPCWLLTLPFSAVPSPHHPSTSNTPALHQTRLLLLHLAQVVGRRRGSWESRRDSLLPVHAPISLWRSSWMENPILFLHPWRCCCIPMNCMGRAPDQRRQGRGALAGQTVPSTRSPVLPAPNSPRGTSDGAMGLHRTAGATSGCHGNTASPIPSHCPEELENLSKIGWETIFCWVGFFFVFLFF